MSTKLKELQQKRQKLAAEIRRFADEAQARTKEGKPAFDEEQRKNYDQLNTDYDAVMGELKRENEASELENRRKQLDDDDKRGINGGGFNPRGDDFSPDHRSDGGNHRGGSARDLALHAWFRAGAGLQIGDEHRQACKQLGMNPRSKRFDIKLDDEQRYRQRQRAYRSAHESQRHERAMSVGTDNAGGYMVPEGFGPSLEIAMLAFNGVEPLATVLLTETGNPLPMPTADDTGNEGEIIGENTGNNSADPTIGQKMFGAYKFSSKFIKLSYELLEDSAFNLAQIVGSMCGERIGRHAEKKFTVGAGSGSSEPMGIVTAATVGKTAASQTAIAADELVDLQHSIDPAYRSGPGVGWQMHDTVTAYVRKLKDSEGRYLWSSGLQAGVPDLLLGYPLSANQNMASSIAASAKTVLFGAISKYHIRRVRTVRLVRLNERFADLDQVAFIAFVRQDGNLMDAGVAPVKVLQQAAA